MKAKREKWTGVMWALPCANRSVFDAEMGPWRLYMGDLNADDVGGVLCYPVRVRVTIEPGRARRPA